MEFHQMEEEAHKQTEREELLKEIRSEKMFHNWFLVKSYNPCNNINVFYNFHFSSSELEKEVKRHESQLSDLEEQQKKSERKTSGTANPEK